MPPCLQVAMEVFDLSLARPAGQLGASWQLTSSQRSPSAVAEASQPSPNTQGSPASAHISLSKLHVAHGQGQDTDSILTVTACR